MLLDLLLQHPHTLALLAVLIDTTGGGSGCGHFDIGLTLGSADGEGEVALALLLHEAVAEGEAVGEGVA
jgi:hypothetical protein